MVFIIKALETKKVLCTVVEFCLACPVSKTKNNAFIITFGTYVRVFLGRFIWCLSRIVFHVADEAFLS